MASNALHILPFFTSFRLSRNTGGKDKAGAAIVRASYLEGMSPFVLPLPWGGVDQVQERFEGRHEIYFDEQNTPVTLLPTYCHPNGCDVLKRGWRRLRESPPRGAPLSWLGQTFREASFALETVVEATLGQDRFAIAHNHQSGSAFPEIVRQLGNATLPLVLTNHSNAITPYLDAYDHVVFVSESQREQTLKERPELEPKTSLIHYYGSNEFLTHPVAELGEGFVFAGLMHNHRKGFDLLLEAYQVDHTLHGTPLRLAGDGKLFADNKGAAEQHALPFRFYGHQKAAELAALVAGAKAFVMPSRAEGLALAYIEALCVGAPIIGYPPNVYELENVLQMPVGLAFDANAHDGKALADTLHTFLQHPEFSTPGYRQELARRARARFSPERFISQYRELYRRLLYT
ncbi:MAG: glycosyltransferase family 4 protein [Verrucomicrobiota bacterium JB022]|nr:glycosyltransferase family 4 protein [Verrucomicrobiota bacterium JB022]